MRDEIIMLLLGAAISLVSTIILSLLNNRNEDRRVKDNRKAELIDRVYQDRLIAYKELYAGFTKVKRVIDRISVDILGEENYSELDITELVDDLEKIYQSNIIFYNQKSSNSCIVAIVNLTQMSGFILDYAGEKDVDISVIVEMAVAVNKNIDSCLLCIKKEMGLNELEAVTNYQ